MTAALDPAIHQAMALHYDAGLPSQAVADIFGVSDSTARNAVRRHGSLRPRGGRPRAFTEGEKARMRDMRAAGLTRAEAAREMGADPRTLLAFYDALPWAPREYLSDGYVVHHLPSDDPMARMRRVDGTVLKHRLVMARFLGRPLTPSEQVHHINGDRMDNEIENLQLRRGPHGKGIALRCGCCGSVDIQAVEV